MLSARENMDVVDAYARVGSYRGAAAICGVDPKTVKRKVLAHQRGELDEERARREPVAKNTDRVRDVVLDRVREAKGAGDGEAVAAGRSRCWLWRFGSELPASGVVGEAAGAW